MKEEIKELINMYPNDSELGKHVRDLFAKKTVLNTFLEYKSIKKGDKIKIFFKNGGIIDNVPVTNNVIDGNILEIDYGSYGYEKIKNIELK